MLQRRLSQTPHQTSLPKFSGHILRRTRLSKIGSDTGQQNQARSTISVLRELALEVVQRQLYGVKITGQVHGEDVESGLFGLFHLRRVWCGECAILLSSMSITIPSWFRNTGSGPAMPALATTMSILPDGDTDLAFRKRASWSSHFVTSQAEK